MNFTTYKCHETRIWIYGGKIQTFQPFWSFVWRRFLQVFSSFSPVSDIHMIGFSCEFAWEWEQIGLTFDVFFSATYNADVEDPYPSLSDFHDYEPNLEFDDSDLLQQKHPENDDDEDFEDLQSKADGSKAAMPSSEYIQSPMSDGTIEEDFEQALAREVADHARRSSEDHYKTIQGTSIEDIDFSDIARHGILEVVGDDVAGRKIIVISACRLPSNKSFDYAR